MKMICNMDQILKKAIGIEELMVVQERRVYFVTLEQRGFHQWLLLLKL
jgi:hypothetical protein